jgi:hypothetical protein
MCFLLTITISEIFAIDNTFYPLSFSSTYENYFGDYIY